MNTYAKPPAVSTNRVSTNAAVKLLTVALCLCALFPEPALARAKAKPLKVFILAGQSNMQGHAKVSTIDYIGDDPQTAPILKEMRDSNGEYRLVKDTWISYLTHGRGVPNGEGLGQLTAGFGARQDPAKDGGKIGPEFTFGIYTQKALRQPILIIKTAWGGKSLHTDFRPPSAGPYEFNESELASIERRGLDLDEERAKKKAATGMYYRLMVQHVKRCLKDIKRVYPDYDADQGYEIAGFVWFQGWNDVVNSGVYPRRGQAGGYDKYSAWLGMLIRDVRRDLSAPKIPFVIGVLGTNGPIENIAERYRPIHGSFRQAMAAPAALPEFKGNVSAVETAPCWDMTLDRIAKKREQLNQKKRSLEKKIKQGEDGRDGLERELTQVKAELASPADTSVWKRGASNAAYHYLGCAKTMALIGKRFAEGILELQPSQRKQQGDVSGALRLKDLRCEYQDQPLGIDHPAPRLSWVLDSQLRDQSQNAYRVRVAGSLESLQAGRADLWDSGKVTSSQSVNIRYAGTRLSSGQACFWQVRVWDKEGVASAWSAPSSWEMGLLKASDWTGQWISDGKPLPETDADFYQDDPAPLFRREFKLSGPVRRARLYISALGYVHARLNGQTVGDHLLDPIWTLPNKRVFYSVHDVSKQLQQGNNCLGVSLGNGWYNPVPLRMWGHVNLRERLPVGRPQFIAQLHVEYADGSCASVASDAAWKVAPGPILRNSIYLGEKVDARKAVKGWDRPGLNDHSWHNASIAPVPAGPLQAQPLEPIKVTAPVKPIRVTEPSEGVYIVDMGQNFGGWARFRFDVPAGTEVKLRYGELLYEDGTLNPMTSVCGQIKRKKTPTDGSPAVAWQADTYIARGGGPETYTPRFTFHAFRYVEITGLPARPSLNDVEGLRMNCDVEPVGAFACSNELFTRTQTMCEWTFLSNLFGVQSDCPHRERFGYGGDLVSTSDTFMLNYDMANFYAKATRDWHDSALPNGMLTDTAPSVGIQYCGVGWAMAHAHLQEQLYRYYGDRRIIEEQYATSKRWLDLVRSQNPDHIVRKGLHDHEALEKEKSPPMITPLYCESARMLSRLAGILGKEAEAQEYAQLAEQIRKAYIKEFLSQGSGVVASGIQSVQAFALFLDMLPAQERAAALAHLLKDVTDKHNGHLTTGIFGTRYMLDVLSREGHAELVNNMVNLKDFPGWGHMLEQGATTLWEHWKFSDNTFSHNHPMFGSVSQWFYNWLGGIEPAVDAVGFDRFRIQPQFLEGLDWVRCSYRSVRGPITCNWKRKGQQVALDLQIPVNSCATLVLPNTGRITENDRPVSQAQGVRKLSKTDGCWEIILGSGRYNLVFTP
jgi:alpha-L-rhamnosidase